MRKKFFSVRQGLYFLSMVCVLAVTVPLSGMQNLPLDPVSADDQMLPRDIANLVGGFGWPGNDGAAAQPDVRTDKLRSKLLIQDDSDDDSDDDDELYGGLYNNTSQLVPPVVANNQSASQAPQPNSANVPIPEQNAPSGAGSGEIDYAEINDALVDAANASQQTDSNQIMAEYEAGQAREAAEELQRVQKAHVEQNTLLCRVGKYSLSAGIYKRDLIEAALFAFDIQLDWWLYKKLHQIRLETITQSIIKNASELEDVLLKVKNEQSKWQTDFEKKNVLMKALTAVEVQKAMLLSPLKAYLRSKHSYIQYNPFKKETIVPLIARLSADKLGKIAHDKLIVDYASPHLIERTWAYEKNDKGEITMTPPAISLTRILKDIRWWISPSFTQSADTAVTALEWFGKVWTWIGKIQNRQEHPDAQVRPPSFNLEKVLSSRPFKLTIEFLILGLAVKFFDSASSDIWVDYVITNQEPLLELLTEYRLAKESFKDEATIKGLEKRIKKFISKGHKTVSFLPVALLRQWWTARTRSSVVGACLAITPFVAFAGYKFWKWFYQSPPQTQTEGSSN
jgi:hypothetical protein